MKINFGPMALMLTSTVCVAVEAQAAPSPPTGQSTAIAVDGNYVYVVENGSVYKLSSKDLKPVATARLQTAPATKPVAVKARKSARPKPYRKSRMSRRQKPVKARTTWRRMPVPANPTEAPLPQ